MQIVIQDPNGFEVLTLNFSLLDINISKRRHVLIKSIATENGFLTGTTIRKNTNGISYVEIRMKPETPEKNVSKLVKELVNNFF